MFNISDNTMDDLTGIIIPIAGMLFVLAIVYIRRVVPQRSFRDATARSAVDEQTLAIMVQTAHRLESRINSLEQILDSEVPNWRNRL